MGQAFDQLAFMDSRPFEARIALRCESTHVIHPSPIAAEVAGKAADGRNLNGEQLAALIKGAHDGVLQVLSAQDQWRRGTGR